MTTNNDQSQTTDPRVAAVRQHFQEWHGAAPDDIEINALLKAIDAVKPDLFWDNEDTENGATDMADILENYSPGEVVRIQRAVRLHDVFAVQCEKADRSGYETREFDSIEEAEAWVTQRMKELAHAI